MEQLFKLRKKRLDLFRQRRGNEPHERMDIPENLFLSCSDCKENIPYEQLMQHLYVCPHCGCHLKISARERIRQISDENSFKELDKTLRLKEVPCFPGYQKKLEVLQQKTGLQEAFIYGVCKIHGISCVLGVMDSNFFMGSMGSVVGEKVTRCIEYATKKKLPLILFSASGGARMQEGILSLMQMAKTSAALGKHKAQGLLYISFLTHPTTGGVSASFAMLGDIQLAEPNALIGFAGKRVIASTLKEELPKDFQRAEFLLKKGFLDCIVTRKHAKEVLYRLLKMHEGGSLCKEKKK